jgi:hypothetical protein
MPYQERQISSDDEVEFVEPYDMSLESAPARGSSRQLAMIVVGGVVVAGLLGTAIALLLPG